MSIFSSTREAPTINLAVMYREIVAFAFGGDETHRTIYKSLLCEISWYADGRWPDHRKFIELIVKDQGNPDWSIMELADSFEQTFKDDVGLLRLLVHELHGEIVLKDAPPRKRMYAL